MTSRPPPPLRPCPHGISSPLEPLALALLLALACSPGARKSEAAAGLGRAVWSGPARSLRASPDGAWLAFLDGCREAKGQFLPPRTANCDLRAVPAAGGEARVVARAVTTLPQGYVWSGSAATLAALGGYDYAAGAGELTSWRPDSGAREIAREVSFYGFGPSGALGVVSGGRLLVGAPGAGVTPVAGASEVATFELSPRPPGAILQESGSPVEALARRTAAAGGALLAVAGGEARPVASGVTDYAFAPDGEAFAYIAGSGGQGRLATAAGGAAVPRMLGAPGVRGFSYWAAGPGSPPAALAFIEGAAPGKQGDLEYLDVLRGTKHAPLGAREVGEYRWARAAPRLAWLEQYDPRVRAGTLGVGGIDLPTRRVAAHVSDFDLAPDGARVAFLQHTTRGGYSVDLALADLAAPSTAAPTTVAQGVFGFAFSPDGRWLYYRTRCTRNGEACDLERVPAAGPAPGAGPERIAQGAKSFDFDPRDPGRLLVGFQRMDMVALDVAVWEGGRLVAVDRAVEPGTAQFLPPDSRRLAYVVVQPKRAGVYVAELPR